LNVAQFTVTLRTFLMQLRDQESKTWEDIDSLMDEINSGRIKVPVEINMEIEIVNKEIRAREMTKILIEKLTQELPLNGMNVSHLNGTSPMTNMDVENLSDLIEGCKKEEELNGKLDDDLMRLMYTATLIGRFQKLKKYEKCRCVCTYNRIVIIVIVIIMT